MGEIDKQIEQLILKYARREFLNGDEQAMLDQWRQESAENDALPDKFRNEEWVQKNLMKVNRVPSGLIWEGISQRLPGRAAARIIKTPWYKSKSVAVSAAAVLLILVTTIAIIKWLIPQRLPDSGAQGMTATARGIDDHLASFGSLADLAASAVAGHHKELLTLIDGAHILSTGLTRPDALVLPDGSKVWLSHASSICYPGAFTGAQRVVRLSGEAYFEIAKDVIKAKDGNGRPRPFIIETQSGITQDLSTAFNIKAYPGDPDSRVTLIEGAVIVRKGKDSVKLDQPLDQAWLAADGSRPRKEKGSGDALAWRRGVFAFSNTDLRTAMRELARWYHKTVQYSDATQGVPIDINLEQSMSWEQVLDAMRKFEHGFAHIEVVGDNVIISAAHAGN